MSSRAEAEFSGAKISVWWDIEKCPVPMGCDPNTIAKNIFSALAKLNYCGPITIYVYCDLVLMPTAVHEALTRNGISFNHVPAGSEDKTKKMLVDMLLWSIENPAPANYLLISGDMVFSYVLHNLDMLNYNILLAHPQPIEAFDVLLAAATCVWHWRSLANGGLPFTHTGENSDGISDTIHTSRIAATESPKKNANYKQTSTAARMTTSLLTK